MEALFIFEGNTLMQVLIFMGVCVGVLSGFSDSYKDLLHKELAEYSGAWTQFINRALIVSAFVMCLFVDFPERREHPLQELNWILFPFLAAMFFCLAWCCAFWATLAVKAVFCWVFDSLIQKID